MRRILITGALGQIGTELTLRFREIYGKANVVATDIFRKDDSSVCSEGIFEVLDVLNFAHFGNLISKYKINYIVHLASLLSASGEANPQLLWQLNMGGLYNALELAREFKTGFFTPSSIASFGLSTPRENTPQDVIQRPNTIYGVSKVAGELLCDYYFAKYGVDTRGLRFPGLISHTAIPGGGTTDYAVEIYYKALTDGSFVCPLKEDSYLDMMYMEDAIDAVIKLIEADGKNLKHRNAFNVSAMSFCPKEIALEIKKLIPNFEISYKVNPILQNIADSWPKNMDCTCAKEEWGFNPKFNLQKMTNQMLLCLKEKLVH
jgi:nucleoside-diphosphate-sugar epimerase